MSGLLKNSIITTIIIIITIYGADTRTRDAKKRAPRSPYPNDGARVPCEAPSFTPNPPPTKSFPAKSPRVELSGRLPIKFYGHENSHPLELRVCLSQTL